MESTLNHWHEILGLPLSNPVAVFSLLLFIILLAPLFLAKLKIPSIIGLIFAGVLIGPYSFHILEKNSAMDLFSTIGLLYIMFLAGLELNLAQFKKNKHKSLLFGLLTLVIPMLIGFPFFYWILDYNLRAGIIISSMFSTYTLVSYPIVSKFGIAGDEAVAVSVGGTLFTDTSVLLLLAVILESTNGVPTTAFWMRIIISLLVFLVIMVYAIPRLAAWFFKRLEGEKSSHFIFVLAMVFFGALLAQMAGIEPIVGAFAAGLTLNRLIPPLSALRTRIEFFGNAIFIPFFLISVGMLVNPRAFLQGLQSLYMILFLTAISIAGKWISAYITQKMFRFSPLQRKLTFGLIVSQAAATLAIVLIGYKESLLDENILNASILLVLITCTISSFLVEKNAKHLVYEQEKLDSLYKIHESDLPQVTVIPVANPKNLPHLIDFAHLSNDYKRKNSTRLLSIVNNDHNAENNLHRVNKLLDDYIKYAAEFDMELEKVITLDFNTASGIIRASREHLAQTLIMGWPLKETLMDKFFGQITSNIIRNLNKNTFICNIPGDLARNRGMVIFCPELSEMEKGFKSCIGKLLRLSTSLKIPVKVYSNSRAMHVIDNYMSENKFKNEIQYAQKDGLRLLENLYGENLRREFPLNQIFIFFTGRPGSFSYQSGNESFYKKFHYHFPESSHILVYPE